MMPEETIVPAPLLLPLDTLPRHDYAFLWADYVELLCLCSKNGFVSKGNLQAQTQEAQDIQVDADEEMASMSGADMDDRVSTKWNDIHQRLSARSLHFSGWPFVLEKNVLRSAFKADNAAHRLYAALLLASSLRLCDRRRSNEVTTAFEEISYRWLCQSLNDNWIIRTFGAHQTHPHSYRGTLLEKITALAKDINATLVKAADDYDPSNTGDGGIDLVAWQNLGDARGHIPLIFGQCACSPKDWESKQLDVTPAAIESHLVPKSPGAAYCFVPHDLSESDTKWQRASHVKRTVIIDRIRLLKLLSVDPVAAMLPHWTFVAEAVQSDAIAAT